MESKEAKNAEDWSADGKYLLYNWPRPRADVFVLPLTAEPKPRAFLGEGFEEIQSQLSPDVKWLAYVSNESGRPEVYVQRFPNQTGKWYYRAGRKRKLTSDQRHRELDGLARVKEEKMFRGLRTVIYHVSDLEKAKKWYSTVLGFQPYFDEPFYVGFNVGGFELGLDPDMSGVREGNNVLAYWGAANAETSYKRLLELGAKEHRPVQEVGEGIRVGTVMDPFGNVLGVIENPHFKVEDVR